ncbi:hypothetical protein Rhopal_007334-T1 [Rhodotorula paludigena]|uniref:Proteophosphoglycan ppg4 n=1 Tax=Rhodotorula paludigena TaxID=86838 RepID=A0AAV5GXR6_9BASI|nr:hypothetical protein Rhopal_007334-T1 [Rhodotorula paludigena]
MASRVARECAAEAGVDGVPLPFVYDSLKALEPRLLAGLDRLTPIVGRQSSAGDPSFVPCHFSPAPRQPKGHTLPPTHLLSVDVADGAPVSSSASSEPLHLLVPIHALPWSLAVPSLAASLQLPAPAPTSSSERESSPRPSKRSKTASVSSGNSSSLSAKPKKRSAPQLVLLPLVSLPPPATPRRDAPRTFTPRALAALCRWITTRSASSTLSELFVASPAPTSVVGRALSAARQQQQRWLQPASAAPRAQSGGVVLAHERSLYTPEADRELYEQPFVSARSGAAPALGAEERLRALEEMGEGMRLLEVEDAGELCRVLEDEWRRAVDELGESSGGEESGEEDDEEEEEEPAAGDDEEKR